MIHRRRFFPIDCRVDSEFLRQDLSIYPFSPVEFVVRLIEQIQMFRISAYQMIAHFCLLPSRTQHSPLDHGT